VDPVLYWLDLCGVAVFAASGALTASRKQMDLVGFVLIAAVTGIGGGTLRDLVLGAGPVFWMHEPLDLYLCTAVAMTGFFAAPLLESRYRVLLWADAIGLAVFCVNGAEAALRVGAPGPIAAVMGVMTASFGGLVRDILCNEAPLILRREVYATAAAAGAVVYVGLTALQAGRTISAILGIAAAFAPRAVGIVYGVSLPRYRSRPGRYDVDLAPLDASGEARAP
jgi:uncharacterized membrane protein YeiH